MTSYDEPPQKSHAISSRGMILKQRWPSHSKSLQGPLDQRPSNLPILWQTYNQTSPPMT